MPEICQWVDDTARSVGFPEREAERWELALEEVAINIVHYAYGDDPVGMIELEIRRSTSEMTVQISDTGQPFNPLAAPEPKIGVALEERKIGGLWIYLARKVVDRVHYERRDGKKS